mgnify:CR=1 FL=1
MKKILFFLLLLVTGKKSIAKGNKFSENSLSFLRPPKFDELRKESWDAGGSGVQKPCRPRPSLPLPAVKKTAGRGSRVLEPQAPIGEPAYDDRPPGGRSFDRFPRPRPVGRDHARDPRLPGRLLRRRPRRRLPEKPLCAHLPSFLPNPEIYSELGRKEGIQFSKNLSHKRTALSSRTIAFQKHLLLSLPLPQTLRGLGFNPA